MILQKNLITNDIFQASALQENCVEITGQELQDFLLQKAKDQKLIELQSNFENAVKKDHSIKDAKQINNLGQEIGIVDAYFSIKDPKILTHETAVVFAGFFKTQEEFLKLIVSEIKKINSSFPDYQTLREDVFKANQKLIPYQTKNKNGDDIKIWLSAKEIRNIFSHIFDRVSKCSGMMGIIKDQIENASSLKELENIDITFKF